MRQATEPEKYFIYKTRQLMTDSNKAKLEGVEDRSANFCCALALKIPGREPVIAEGKCPGVILHERRGTGGFGYDPLFYCEILGKTFAEVNEAEKNAVSHRARACEAMKEKMAAL